MDRTTGKPVAPAVTDGRKQRSNASRQKIVQAFFELIGAGNINPSAEQIATHSGVALRTVFRRFNEIELLYRELNTKIEEIFADEVFEPLPQLPWQQSLDSVLERKMSIFEKTIPYRLAMRNYKHNSEFLQQRLQHWFNVEEKVYSTHLPFDLEKNKAAFEGLMQATSIDTYMSLRYDRKLSQQQAYECMQTMSKGILSQFK
ncbi:TetR/AcrR family transcriptional regulator [Paraferrimonas sp. SM1919]|uniref:TetR/AcrR family transcriptional regulator n=1 Tax=Paraferrimonas sp. SM1919 TaxID=2662263 RepID=UPI0013D23BAA|nr:TetR/AcrR family transcriptional regulator [Paraferrimonas sp. SM1919]